MLYEMSLMEMEPGSDTPILNGTIFRGQYVLQEGNESVADYLVPFDYSLVTCRVVAILLYFFWLSTCTWCFIEAFQIIYNYHFKMYVIGSEVWHLALFGWGVPLIAISAWTTCILMVWTLFHFNHLNKSIFSDFKRRRRSQGRLSSGRKLAHL